MPLALLERENPLSILHEALARTRAGTGQAVLVAGEAGIGKSSLIGHFAKQARQAGAPRVLWGGCDALSTPRPLGPLYDIAAQGGGRLSEVLQQQPVLAAVFATLHADLAAYAQQASAPSLLIIEDLH